MGPEIQKSLQSALLRLGLQPLLREEWLRQKGCGGACFQGKGVEVATVRGVKEEGKAGDWVEDTEVTAKLEEGAPVASQVRVVKVENEEDAPWVSEGMTGDVEGQEGAPVAPQCRTLQAEGEEGAPTAPEGRTGGAGMLEGAPAASTDRTGHGEAERLEAAGTPPASPAKDGTPVALPMGDGTPVAPPAGKGGAGKSDCLPQSTPADAQRAAAGGGGGSGGDGLWCIGIVWRRGNCCTRTGSYCAAGVPQTSSER